MYIKHCPIPFHDLMEIYDFLVSLSPQMAAVFDGCYIFDYPLQFFSTYSSDLSVRYLRYVYHRNL